MHACNLWLHCINTEGHCLGERSRPRTGSCLYIAEILHEPVSLRRRFLMRVTPLSCLKWPISGDLMQLHKTKWILFPVYIYSWAAHYVPAPDWILPLWKQLNITNLSLVLRNYSCCSDRQCTSQTAWGINLNPYRQGDRRGELRHIQRSKKFYLASSSRIKGRGAWKAFACWEGSPGSLWLVGDRAGTGGSKVGLSIKWSGKH